MHSIHLRRLLAKSRCRGHTAHGRPPIVVYGGPSPAWIPERSRSGVCLRAVWFVIGGIAVVCWTEKLGTKKNGEDNWAAHELHKHHEKKMEYVQNMIACHGAQWAAMHKGRDSSQEKRS